MTSSLKFSIYIRLRTKILIRGMTRVVNGVGGARMTRGIRWRTYARDGDTLYLNRHVALICDFTAQEDA